MLSTEELWWKMAVEMLPVFLTEEFSAEGVNALTDRRLISVWCRNAKVFTNADDLDLRLLDTGIEAGYEIQFVN